MTNYNQLEKFYEDRVSTHTVLGKFHGIFQSANATALQDIYIAKGLQKTLLGKPTIEALGVAVRVDQILDSKATLIAKFPQLFHGLEKPIKYSSKTMLCYFLWLFLEEFP